MPTVFMGEGGVETGGEVIEPEVLESLEDVDRPGFPGTPGAGPQFRPLGCTVGPGCGCLGLPLMVAAGVVVSSVIALLWVLSLGRLPVSLVNLAKQARRGFNRS
jgi:hypothetical protein